MKDKIIVILIASIITILITITFSSYLKTNVYAEAVPVTPDGLEVPTGIYAISSLLSGGLATHNTIADGQKLVEQSTAIWEQASPAVKESLNNAITYAINTGQSTINLTSEFVDWFKTTAIDMFKPHYSVPSQTIADGVYNLGIRASSNSSTLYLDFPTHLNVSFMGYSNVQRILLWTSSGNVSIYVNGVANSETGLFSSSEALDIRNQYNNLQNSVLRAGYLYELFSYLSSISMSADTDFTKTPIDNYAEQVEKGLEPVFNHVIDKGISIPLDAILASAATASGFPLTWDKTLGKYKLPDGTLYDPAIDGPVTYNPPIAQVETAPDGTAVIDETTGLPKINVYDKLGTLLGVLTTVFAFPNVLTGEPTTPPTEPTPTKPPHENAPFKPYLLLLGFLDLLRALVMYLLRMVEFILTLAFIPSKEIPTYLEGFNFFKNLEVKQINMFSTIMMLFNFALGFVVFKVIQKIFNSSGG